jgi:hypothetical protein
MMNTNNRTERFEESELATLRDAASAIRSAATNDEAAQSLLDLVWTTQQADRERLNRLDQQLNLPRDDRNKAMAIIAERMAALSLASLETRVAAMDRLVTMGRRVNNALDSARRDGYSSVLPKSEERRTFNDVEAENFLDTRVKNTIVGTLQMIDAIEQSDDDVVA